MDQLFENFFERSPMMAEQGGTHTPPVEVAQTNDAVTVKVQVPGVAKDKLQVTIDNDTLILHGERQEERKQEGQQYFRREFHYGAFDRTIPLPVGVMEDQATAQLKDGVLIVTVPKGQQARTKRITIEGAAHEAQSASAPQAGQGQSRTDHGQPQAQAGQTRSHAEQNQPQAQAGQGQLRAEQNQPQANQGHPQTEPRNNPEQVKP
jgi:HSP20 family protein